MACLLCALVRLRHDPGTSWMPRLMLLVETQAALFTKADHVVIQRAWRGLGSTRDLGEEPRGGI